MAEGTGMKPSSSSCPRATSVQAKSLSLIHSMGSIENDPGSISTTPSSFMSAQWVPFEVPIGDHRLCSRCSQRGYQPRGSLRATLYQKLSIDRENSNDWGRNAAPA